MRASPLHSDPTMTDDHQPLLDPVDAEILDVLVGSRRQFLSFLERRVDDRDTAEEILQTAFAKAAAKSGSIRSAESSTAWFYRVLRNAVHDDYRQRGARTRLHEAFGTTMLAATEPDDGLRGEVCACIAGLLPTLRPHHAEILRAVDLEGRAATEVAAELGITPNNANVRLHRARRALRERLEQACSTCAEHGCLHCTCKAPKSASRASEEASS